MPGSPGWVELLTRAPQQAVSFCTTVSGWSVDPSRRYPRWGVGGADFGGMVTMDEKLPHEMPTVEGTVLMEPVSHSEGPRIAVLRDPQGATFGVYRAAGER